MTSIDLVGAHVDYPIYTGAGRSLRSQMLRAVGGNLNYSSESVVTVKALEDINLSFRPGERVAIFGGNGAGKSTLLKVLSGIVEPTAGSAAIVGRISALLDMSMGMDFEATGYENIVMRSVFLGSSYKDAHARIAEIEELSGLGAYLSFPLRTYSAGMVVRLAFAISTSITAEILVLDEHIGAADAAFAARARERILTLVGRAKILVFATHSLSEAEALCARAIILDRGQVSFDGPIGHALSAYARMVRLQADAHSARPGAEARA